MRLPWWLRLALAPAAGFAVYLGFAPSTWWWAPIVGFALLGLAVGGTRPRMAAAIGFLFGLGMFLPLLSFTNIYVGNTPWLALSIAEALLVAPATALMAGPGAVWPVRAAAAWVLGESLRNVFPFGGFAWGTVAFTQAEGPLLPAVALVGEAGLSFLVVLLGFLVAEAGARLVAATRADRLRAVAAVAAVACAAPLVAIAGAATMPDFAAAPSTTVALVQGNVPEPGLEFNARRREVLNMHAAQTGLLADAIAAGTAAAPDWVLWPENSSDIDPYRNADAAEVIGAAARKVGVPILVGAVVAAEEPGRVYNMGIVWDPYDGPGQTYTKRHPVPFAEYIPWRSFFRVFSDKVDLVRADFLPGDRPGNLDIAGSAVGDVICFEVVEEGLVRDVVRGGAEMLVVQTNNATFGYTNETYQQQAMSRIRAVEHGRAVLIAATSGVSAVIRPDGSVAETVGLFTPGYIVADVPQLTSRSPGTVVGGPLRWLLTAAAPILLLVRLVRERRDVARPPAARRRREG